MKKLFSMLVLLPFLVGCSKDEDIAPGNNKEQIKSCYTKEVLFGNDIKNYYYDENGLLVKEQFYESTVFIDACKYEYQNNKLSKIITLDKDGNSKSEFTVSTDDAGRIIQASSTDKTYLIQYDNNSRVIDYQEKVNNTLKRHYTIQYNANKVLIFSPPKTYPIREIETDNKYNPFSVSIKEFVFEWNFLKNNPLKDSNTQTDGTWTYQYNYDSDGYPVNGICTYPSGSTQNFSFTYHSK